MSDPKEPRISSPSDRGVVHRPIDDQQSEGHRETANVSNLLLEALTQQEIAQLLDALFEVMSSEQQERAISQLEIETQQTVKQILSSPPTGDRTLASDTQIISSAKQAQTWSELWQQWDAIVHEASAEEGQYIYQEVDWEPPYFDETTFVEDLEEVAAKMRPLIPIAFEREFTPEGDFASALLEAEAEVAGSLPDWMEIVNGLCIERQLTCCVLEWAWLTLQRQGEDAFGLAQCIQEYDGLFCDVVLERDAILDFFSQLPAAQKQRLFDGLSANKETALWKSQLEDVSSPWHCLYLDLVEQYAPDRYLDSLRETIPQQWQNGLPIIEAFLEQQDYPQSQQVIEETLEALLASRRDISWTPESSLLFVALGLYCDREPGNITTLLRYARQTAEALNQPEKANALEIQQIAFWRWFDWSAMFAAFTEIRVSAATRQALFGCWRDYVARLSKPRTYGYGYIAVKAVKTWWVQWLINSIADSKKGAKWFERKMTQWLADLPGDKTELGEEYDLLRLLTKDLTEIQHGGESDYPQFYRVVIRPQELKSQDERARRDYLQQYAPADLLERAIDYWKAHLHRFVPKPELAQKSNYTEHARSMAALKELSSQDYQILLASWRVDHKRRRNLWKAMKQVDLEH